MQNGLLDLGVVDGQDGAVSAWTLRLLEGHGVLTLQLPTLEVDGVAVQAALSALAPVGEPVTLPNGVVEHVLAGHFVALPELRLALTLRSAPQSPIVRFRYRVTSTAGHCLTKATGRDGIVYTAMDTLQLPEVTEVRLSEFQELVHSFVPVEEALDSRHFEDGLSVMGPILTASDGYTTALLAYEHGSQVPDRYLEFRLSPDQQVALAAVKGNYPSGMSLAGDGWESIWLQAGLIEGDESDLAAAYRQFVLHEMCVYPASRKPYIFYNTWAYQERNKWYNDARFLDSMTQERMLAEIDVAHRMGVEVFVMDTGWYQKTGDWEVNRARFPDNLRAVKAKLDGYGMKLGLWFDPNHAAISSKVMANHPTSRTTWKGETPGPYPIWETEASQRMCLASGYADAFADELVRLNREVGVTYFKWDAIGQYGCDSAEHDHGDVRHSVAERHACFSFEVGRAMIRVVERLQASCPEAIVDFDVTEGRRFVGLGFLSVGKYFLINNGPYYQNYDIPQEPKRWSNIFVNPGPARGWVCRTPLAYDRWIPSVLFLTHYLPDDPADSQLVNLGSLILGQNGIWGDLLSVSDAGIARFAQVLGLYRQVRADITESNPARTGLVGGSPEVHEKIAAGSGRGVVVLFAGAEGVYRYVTQHQTDARHWASTDAKVSRDARGRAVIEVALGRHGVAILFFGVEVGAGV